MVRRGKSKASKPAGPDRPQTSWYPPAKHLTPEGRITDSEITYLNFGVPPRGWSAAEQRKE